MKNTLAYGLSKFRIKSIEVDVNSLIVSKTFLFTQKVFTINGFEICKVKAEIQLDSMLIKGNYTLSSLFTSANGPFTVTLKNVVAKGNASVAVELDGKIRTQDISMDMTFSDLATDFQNLGTFCLPPKFRFVRIIYSKLLLYRIYGQHIPRYHQ